MNTETIILLNQEKKDNAYVKQLLFEPNNKLFCTLYSKYLRYWRSTCSQIGLLSFKYPGQRGLVKTFDKFGVEKS